MTVIEKVVKVSECDQPKPKDQFFSTFFHLQRCVASLQMEKSLQRNHQTKPLSEETPNLTIPCRPKRATT